MKVFALDLWHDLRAKRVWPVALVLLVALIAVPVLLLDGGSDDSSAPPVPGARAGAPGSPQAAVTPADTQGETSDLGEFASKDPFEAADSGGTGSPGKSSMSSGSSGAEASSFAGGGSTGSSGGGVQGSAPGANDKAPVGGRDNQGTEEKKDTTTTTPPTAAFAYTVDIDFGRAGRTHLRRDVVPLEMLPDKRRPLLVFMGVTSTRKTAMFQVDEDLDVEGEGICLPKRTDCRFVYLRTDQGRNVHFFTDPQGRKYTLKLLDINRVPLSELASKKSRSSKKSKASKRSSSYSKSPSLIFGER